MNTTRPERNSGRFPRPGCWGVTPLPNGNILITDTKGVHEVDRDHKTVWEVTRADLPDYKLANLQLAWRLPNGNTLLNNWVNEWSGKIDRRPAGPGAGSDARKEGRLGPARLGRPRSTLARPRPFKSLDQPASPENVTFGDIKYAARPTPERPKMESFRCWSWCRCFCRPPLSRARGLHRPRLGAEKDRWRLRVHGRAGVRRGDVATDGSLKKKTASCELRPRPSKRSRDRLRRPAPHRMSIAVWNRPAGRAELTVPGAGRTIGVFGGNSRPSQPVHHSVRHPGRHPPCLPSSATSTATSRPSPPCWRRSTAAASSTSSASATSSATAPTPSSAWTWS